jgi:predicted dehydrogenase
LLLGSDNPLISISAHTSQIQEYLPPVDTIEAIAKAKNGAVGSISLSFGTTHHGSEWTIACQDGIVSVSGSKVTLKDEITDVEDERTGVPPEVKNWGQALVAGKTNERQSPEEALADLEIIEACLKSGEQDGKPIKLKYQTW